MIECIYLWSLVPRYTNSFSILACYCKVSRFSVNHISNLMLGNGFSIIIDYLLIMIVVIIMDCYWWVVWVTWFMMITWRTYWPMLRTSRTPNRRLMKIGCWRWRWPDLEREIVRISKVSFPDNMCTRCPKKRLLVRWFCNSIGQISAATARPLACTDLPRGKLDFLKPFSKKDTIWKKLEVKLNLLIIYNFPGFMTISTGKLTGYFWLRTWYLPSALPT